MKKLLLTLLSTLIAAPAFAGLSMPLTTDDGMEHPASYWKISEIAIYAANGSASINWQAWHDKAACDAGKKPLAVTHTNSASGADFMSLYTSATTATNLGDSIRQAAEAFALNQQDVALPEGRQEVVDGYGDIIAVLITHPMESFFKNATQVP